MMMFFQSELGWSALELLGWSALELLGWSALTLDVWPSCENKKQKGSAGARLLPFRCLNQFFSGKKRSTA